jgi:hypothetical protein
VVGVEPFSTFGESEVAGIYSRGGASQLINGESRPFEDVGDVLIIHTALDTGKHRFSLAVAKGFLEG